MLRLKNELPFLYVENEPIPSTAVLGYPNLFCVIFRDLRIGPVPPEDPHSGL